MDLLNPVLEEMVAECIHKMPKDALHSNCSAE